MMEFPGGLEVKDLACHLCGGGSIPGPGSSACLRHSQKKKMNVTPYLIIEIYHWAKITNLY